MGEGDSLTKPTHRALIKAVNKTKGRIDIFMTFLPPALFTEPLKKRPLDNGSLIFFRHHE